MLKRWTPEEDEAVIRMVADGKSLAYAAKQLGRSKGAVIGRWDRKLRKLAASRGIYTVTDLAKRCYRRAKGRLKPRPVSEHPGRSRKQKPAKRAAKAAKVKQAAPAPMPQPPEPVVYETDLEAVEQLYELRDDQCRWIHGDTRRSGWRFCTRQAVRGSYCEEHAARAYEKPDRKGAKECAAT